MRALSETGRAIDLVTLDAELAPPRQAGGGGRGAQYLIGLAQRRALGQSNVRAYIQHRR